MKTILPVGTVSAGNTGMTSTYRAVVFWGAVLTIQLFTSFGVQAQATYYVRAGATGSNNGSDWNNAYATLPSSLVRGATYYIADGNYGFKTFNDPLSGTSVITLKKATAADHGTSTGWNVTTMGSAQAVWTGLQFWTAYYVLNGATRGSDWQSGYGFKVQNGGQQYAVDLSCGLSSSTHDLTLEYLEVQGLGLEYWNYTTGTASGNVTHDQGIYAEWAWYGSGVAPNNITIHGCYLHDFGNCAIVTEHAQNWLIEDSVICRNSADPNYHAEALADQASQSFTIRYNILSDIEGVSFITALNRDSNTYTVANWAIYGNVFKYSVGNPYQRSGVGNGCIAVINNENAVNWQIYNNDFINIYGDACGIDLGDNGASGVTGQSNDQIYNNFWFGNSVPADINLFNCSTCKADYSRFDATAQNITQAHVEVNATANTGVFVNYAGGNFNLAADTQPGVALAAPYNVDPNGTIRGADGVWDKGAFQMAGSSTPTLPILSAITASSVGTNGAVINWTANEASTGVVQYGTTTSYGSTVTDNNSALVHADTLANLAPGTVYHYSIQATAGDLTTNSIDYTFTTATPDTTPPTVSVTTPTSGAVVSNSVTLSATAADNSGGSGMASVTFLVDGVAVNTDSSSPYSYTWNSASVANGTHVISATAKDVAGNQATSTSVTVTVQNPAPDTTPPTVSLTAPASGALVSNTITMTATAADNTGGSGMASVTFLVDGAPVGKDASAPYTFSWSSQSVANGAHTVQAQAADVAGNTALSGTVTITVSNQIPTGIVGEWKFNETNGVTMFDASGFNNNGTLSTSVTRVSPSTPGLSFPGQSNNIVLIPDNSSLWMTNAFSIYAAVKVTTNGAYQAIVGKLARQGANSYPFYDYSLVAVATPNGFNARVAVSTAGANLEYEDSTNTLSYETWHQLVGVYNGSTLTIYADGAPSSLSASGTVQNSSQPLYLGCNGLGGDSYDGRLGRVILYNRALSPTEVQNLCAQGTPPQPPSGVR